MAAPTISYCISNVDDETRRFLQSCGLPVIEDFCLQRCGRCYDGPFLIVDEELAVGASHSAILEVIMLNYGKEQAIHECDTNKRIGAHS
jgi:uncharacterized protein YuzB (UPF0349 family)